ncbi:MAG: hypothetical protein EOO40_04430 [Deltaproteobacteria bacterium]|nr:MAG: hypothetical protein EOO40_04430 [Deltaproteobacteria bacterium]
MANDAVNNTNPYNSIKNWHLLTVGHGKLDAAASWPEVATADSYENKQGLARINSRAKGVYHKTAWALSTPLALVDGILGEGKRPASWGELPGHVKPHYAEGVLEPTLDALVHSVRTLCGSVGHAAGGAVGAAGGIVIPLLKANTTAKNCVESSAAGVGAFTARLGAGVGIVVKDTALVVTRLVSLVLKAAWLTVAGALSIIPTVAAWLVFNVSDRGTREAVVNTAQQGTEAVVNAAQQGREAVVNTAQQGREAVAGTAREVGTGVARTGAEARAIANAALEGGREEARRQRNGKARSSEIDASQEASEATLAGTDVNFVEEEPASSREQEY